MTVDLRAPTLDECQQVRVWRNDPAILPSLRTGVKTEDEQAAFFRNVVTNPKSDHRYYAVTMVDRGGNEMFLGLGGLTYLSRAPGDAEISLILDPVRRGEGFGGLAVRALLHQAFDVLGLTGVIGECYRQSYALGFWQRQLSAHAGFTAWSIDTPRALRWRWGRQAA